MARSCRACEDSPQSDAPARAVACHGAPLASDGRGVLAPAQPALICGEREAPASMCVQRVQQRMVHGAFFCFARASGAWWGEFSRAARSPQGRVQRGEPTHQQQHDQIGDRSLRAVGRPVQGDLVPWLLPANSAAATATAKQCQSQRLRAWGPSLSACGGGRQRREGSSSRGSRRFMFWGLLQHGGCVLGAARGGVRNICSAPRWPPPESAQARLVLPCQHAQAALSSFELSVFAQEEGLFQGSARWLLADRCADAPARGLRRAINFPAALQGLPPRGGYPSVAVLVALPGAAGAAWLLPSHGVEHGQVIHRRTSSSSRPSRPAVSSSRQRGSAGPDRD